MVSYASKGAGNERYLARTQRICQETPGTTAATATRTHTRTGA